MWELVVGVIFSLIFSFNVLASTCDFNHNADAIIKAVAEGDVDKVLDTGKPIPTSKKISEIQETDGILREVEVWKKKYDRYITKLKRGKISPEIKESVERQLQSQIESGVIRALSFDEFAEILKKGKIENFLKLKPRDINFDLTSSSIYIRCVKECDDFVEAVNLKNLDLISLENLELFIPDYEAALIHAKLKYRRVARGIRNNDEDHDDSIKLSPRENVDELSSLNINQMTRSDIENATIKDFLFHSEKMNEQTKVLIFDKASATLLNQSGVMNGGIIKVRTVNRETVIVKVLKQRGEPINERFVLQEIRNAKLMHSLGIGPDSHLMKTNNGYNIVMQESKGVNIKDILFSDKASPATKNKIDEILGVNTRNVHEARIIYARKIINDPQAITEMKRIGRILDENNIEGNDLQLMIQPRHDSYEASVQVIDAAGFESQSRSGLQRNTIQIEEFIKKLTTLAESKPSH